MTDSLFIWAQIIGFIAMGINIGCWQLKNPRHILWSGIPSNILSSTHYFMLGAPLGCLTTFLCIARNLGILWVKESKLPYVIGSFICLSLFLGLSSYQAWFDILPLIGVCVPALAFLRRDNRPLIARGNIISNLSWLIYNIIVLSWVGAAAASLCVISSLIGMYRHEEWEIGKCYKSFLPSLTRSLFAFPNFKTYP